MKALAEFQKWWLTLGRADRFALCVAAFVMGFCFTVGFVMLVI